MQVSLIWSCCLSALSPALTPKVVSLATLPASPKAPAMPMMKIIAAFEKPSERHSGQNKAAIIGIVPKEVPMPIVMTSPTKSITNTATNALCSIKGISASTRLSMPPLFYHYKSDVAHKFQAIIKDIIYLFILHPAQNYHSYKAQKPS